jgi:hypothetical protein
MAQHRTLTLAVALLLAALLEVASGQPCTCTYCHQVGVPQVKFSAPVCMNFTASLSDGIMGKVTVAGINVLNQQFSFANPPAICYPIPPATLCLDLYDLQVKAQPTWTLNGCVKAKVKLIGSSLLPDALNSLELKLGCFSAPKPPSACGRTHIESSQAQVVAPVIPRGRGFGPQQPDIVQVVMAPPPPPRGRGFGPQPNTIQVVASPPAAPRGRGNVYNPQVEAVAAVVAPPSVPRGRGRVLPNPPVQIEKSQAEDLQQVDSGVQRDGEVCELTPRATICGDASPNCSPELCTNEAYAKVAQWYCGKTCGLC